jgi:hypothetical protein
VVDIVAAEPGAYELLEQIGLFVRALGRAETGQRPPAVPVANMSEPSSRAVERLVPARFAEMCRGVGRVDIGVVFRDTLLTDQRLGQPIGMVGVVEAKTTLDAEPVVVGRPVLAFHRDDAVVLDLVG